MADEAKQKPVFTVRSGRVKASVWANKITDTETGEIRTRHNVSLTSSYKDKDGNWHESKCSFWLDQCLPASAVLQEVFNKYCLEYGTP